MFVCHLHTPIFLHDQNSFTRNYDCLPTFSLPFDNDLLYMKLPVMD